MTMRPRAIKMAMLAILLVQGQLLQSCQGWQPNSAFIQRQNFRHSSKDLPFSSHLSSSCLRSSSNDSAQDDAKGGGKSKASLVFSGVTQQYSETLPPDTPHSEIVSFLLDPSSKGCCNLALSAGGTRPAVQVERTKALEDLWTRICQEQYGVEYAPIPEDTIIATNSTSQFPLGLTLTTTVYSSVRLINGEETTFPRYVFHMIAEEQAVEGPSSLVWVYNRLTGNHKKPPGILEPSGRAKSSVSVAQLEDGAYAFDFDVSVQITIEFPAFLVKILPVSREKAEEQGSATIAKTVAKDVEMAVEGIYEAFARQLQTQEA